MSTIINAKTLRNELERVVRQARQGRRFTVLYRSRVAFDIVPPSIAARSDGEGVRDALYRAGIGDEKTLLRPFGFVLLCPSLRPDRGYGVACPLIPLRPVGYAG